MKGISQMIWAVVAAISLIYTPPIRAVNITPVSDNVGVSLGYPQAEVPLSGGSANQLFHHSVTHGVHYRYTAKPTVSYSAGGYKLHTTSGGKRSGFSSGGAVAGGDMRVMTSQQSSAIPSVGIAAMNTRQSAMGAAMQPSVPVAATSPHSPLLRAVYEKGVSETEEIGGKLYYWDDEEMDYVLVPGDGAKVGDKNAEGYVWNGSEWVVPAAEVDNPIGSIPWLLFVLLALIGMLDRFAVRSKR